MHFDDRLDTVMRLAATSGGIARIQYRQLIDLLGQASTVSATSERFGAALAKLDELAGMIPAAERAALLREPMVRLANPEFVAWLVDAEPEVASAAIAAADLTEKEWVALIPSLPIRARGILRHRGGFGARVEAVLERLGIGDRGLPPAAPDAKPTISQVASSPERPQRPELVVLEGGGGVTSRRKVRDEPSDAGIGAIVRQIQAFRSARTNAADHATDESAPPPSVHRVPRHAATSAIDFTTDTEGRIDWADGSFAPALVGILLGTLEGESLRQVVQQRQPLRDVTLRLPGAPALTGAWRLDGLPRFGRTDGRFLGYVGRFRRLPAQLQPWPDQTRKANDSMREVLHELRTPANAIQVAAEIIQQQLYGPAPHEYRGLAAAIAGDTAQILAGFEELDRLVRLESGTLPFPSGECEIGSLIVETVARLSAWTAPRGSGLRLPDDLPQFTVAMAPEDAARLIWRLLATLAGLSASGEITVLALHREGDSVILTIDMPAALAHRLDQDDGASQSRELVRSLSAGIFGVAFTLRLAAAEAAAAGGRLVRDGTRFTLTLSGLTGAAAGHTHTG